ncbi:unnamed protein product, partial [Ectocarpus sp. 13 AM-2016]
VETDRLVSGLLAFPARLLPAAEAWLSPAPPELLPPPPPLLAPGLTAAVVEPLPFLAALIGGRRGETTALLLLLSSSPQSSSTSMTSIGDADIVERSSTSRGAEEDEAGGRVAAGDVDNELLRAASLEGVGDPSRAFRRLSLDEEGSAAANSSLPASPDGGAGVEPRRAGGDGGDSDEQGLSARTIGARDEEEDAGGIFRGRGRAAVAAARGNRKPRLRFGSRRPASLPALCLIPPTPARTAASRSSSSPAPPPLRFVLSPSPPPLVRTTSSSDCPCGRRRGRRWGGVAVKPRAL